MILMPPKRSGITHLPLLKKCREMEYHGETAYINAKKTIDIIG